MHKFVDDAQFEDQSKHKPILLPILNHTSTVIDHGVSESLATNFTPLTLPVNILCKPPSIPANPPSRISTWFGFISPSLIISSNTLNIVSPSLTSPIVSSHTLPNTQATNFPSLSSTPGSPISFDGGKVTTTLPPGLRRDQQAIWESGTAMASYIILIGWEVMDATADASSEYGVE